MVMPKLISPGVPFIDRSAGGRGGGLLCFCHVRRAINFVQQCVLSDFSYVQSRVKNLFVSENRTINSGHYQAADAVVGGGC